jgi:hypothetical protein
MHRPAGRTPLPIRTGHKILSATRPKRTESNRFGHQNGLAHWRCPYGTYTDRSCDAVGKKLQLPPCFTHCVAQITIYGWIFFVIFTCWWSNLVQFPLLVHLISYLASFKVKLIDRPTRQCFIRCKKYITLKIIKMIIHLKIIMFCGCTLGCHG